MAWDFKTDSDFQKKLDWSEVVGGDFTVRAERWRDKTWQLSGIE